MTTINDLIDLVRNAKEHTEGTRYYSGIWDTDISTFAELFDLTWYSYDESFSNRMKKHWVHSWICTDTRVGIALYEFDGEFVAFSTQNVRKSDEIIKFLSEEAYYKVFMVVQQIIASQHEHDKHIINPDSDISELVKKAEYYGGRGQWVYNVT